MSRPVLVNEVRDYARTHAGLVRVGTAAVLAVLAVLSALAGGWVFAAWIFVFVVFTGLEWHGIAFGQVRSLAFGVHMAGGLVILAAATLGATGLAFEGVGVTAVLCGAAARRAGREPIWAMAGVLYTLVPGLLMVFLRVKAEPGAATLIWLFATVWATDMAALFVGRAVGGPKLSPTVSPKKTWAGLGGGLAAAAMVGAITGILVPSSSPLALAGLSALLAIVAQLGDLTESAFKRRFGVKDSGVLIPGQGGVLDRVDGLIFAAVAVAALAWAFEGRVLALGALQ